MIQCSRLLPGLAACVLVVSCTQVEYDNMYDSRGTNYVVGSRPVLTLLGDDPINLTVGGAYTEFGAEALDDLDGDLSSQVEITGSVNMSVAGYYTLTYSVTDADGNTVTETRTVIVSAQSDTRAPVITLKGAEPIQLNEGDTYIEPGATAHDNVDGDVSSKIDITHDVNTSTAGAYTVTYTVSDLAGNTATETRAVIVSSGGPGEDLTAPVISLEGDATIQLIVGDAYVEPGATAHDNVDGDVSSKIDITHDVSTSVAGTYTVTYTVSDLAGNTATETRTVVVSSEGPGDDETPPVMALKGASTIELDVGAAYEELGATATDNVDGDVTSSIVIAGDEVNTDVPGTYVVGYTVSDASGNTAGMTRTVVVKGDTDPPVITLNGLDRMELEVGGAYNEPGATAMDDNDGDLSESIRIEGDVNTGAEGTYLVTYTVSDSAGNEAKKTRTVVVGGDVIVLTEADNAKIWPVDGEQAFEVPRGHNSQIEIRHAWKAAVQVSVNGGPLQNTPLDWGGHLSAGGTGPIRLVVVTPSAMDITVGWF